MTPSFTASEPRLHRLYVGVFALAALVMLLAAGWLRFLVPARQPSRVRDLSWPSLPER